MRSLFNFGLECVEVLRAEPVDDPSVGVNASAEKPMVNTVLKLALEALYHRPVREISAVMALVRILSHCVARFHHFWSELITFRDVFQLQLQRFLNFQTVRLFNVEPEVIGAGYLLFCVKVHAGRFQVNNILNDNPLEREHGDLLPGQAVDVLGFRAVRQP